MMWKKLNALTRSEWLIEVQEREWRMRRMGTNNPLISLQEKETIEAVNASTVEEQAKSKSTNPATTPINK